MRRHCKLLTAAGLFIAWTSAAAAQDALVTFKIVNPDVALQLAQAALASCRDAGYQVAVAVVDRFGVPQVMLRDRFAGPHTPDTAIRKAWTAVSFRADTLEMTENTKSGTPQAGARDITGALMLGGGVPIEAQGGIVGGVGVSGAPGGEADDACARAGLEAVQADLEF